MKTAILTMALVSAFAFLAIPAQADNPAQTGSGTDCLNDIITFFQGQGFPPVNGAVVVDPGTRYTVSSTSDTTYVDFFDADGGWIGWNGGSAGGIVPSSAAYGVVCTAALTDPLLGAPIVPDPTGEYTYQDGLE